MRKTTFGRPAILSCATGGGERLGPGLPANRPAVGAGGRSASQPIITTIIAVLAILAILYSCTSYTSYTSCRTAGDLPSAVAPRAERKRIRRELARPADQRNRGVTPPREQHSGEARSRALATACRRRSPRTKYEAPPTNHKATGRQTG